MRARVLTAALAFASTALLSGCPPGRCPRTTASTGLSVGGAQNGTLFVEGQPVRLSMTVPVDGCTNEPAERIAVEVTGPRNEAIAPTLRAEGATFEREIPENSARDFEVEFAPARAGWHRLETTFEYGYGVMLTEVLVSEPSLAEELLDVTLPAAKTCETVVQTPSGALLCGGVVFRDGVQVQEIAAQRVAVAGSSVWTVSQGGALQRWDDTPTGPLLLVDGAPTGLDSPALFASESDVVVAGQTDLKLFALESGALVNKAEWKLPQPLRAEHVVRSGDKLFVASRQLEMNGEMRTQVCPVTVGVPFTLELPCAELAGAPVGAEADAVWIDTGATTATGTVTSHTLRIARVTDGKLATFGVFALPNLWEPAAPLYSGTPTIRYPLFGKPLQPVVPRVSSTGDVVLQAYPAELSDVRANASFVWGTRAGNAVVLRRR